MGEGAVLKSNTKQAISTGSPTSTVVRVNFGASGGATAEGRNRAAEPVIPVDDDDDIDQILNRLREECRNLCERRSARHYLSAIAEI